MKHGNKYNDEEEGKRKGKLGTKRDYVNAERKKKRLLLRLFFLPILLIASFYLTFRNSLYGF